MKKAVFVFLIFPVFMILFQMEGCIISQYQSELSSPSITPMDIAMQNPRVNAFINQYPNAQTSMDYYSEAESKATLTAIKDICPNADAAEIYKITLNDEASGNALTAWVDWRNKEVECVFEGIK